MTAPTPDPWAGLPLTGEQAQALSGGLLTGSSDSAATVARILAWVERYCGWHVVGERTETLTVDGTGTRSLQLPTLRIQSVAEVLEDSWNGSELAAVPATTPGQFTWSANGILEKRSGVWTSERRGVRVTLTHGFARPDALLGVIVSAAIRHSSSPDGNALSRVGEISYQNSGAGSAGGSAFLQSEYAVLDHYRLNPEA